MAKRPTKDYFELTELVYQDTNGKGFSKALEAATPEGFRMVKSSYEVLGEHDYGYNGLAFINDATKEIIIATAGTSANKLTKDFGNLEEDLVSDFDLMHGKVPEQVHTAGKPFMNEVIATLEDAGSLSGYTITFTGHSLGATVSESLAAHYHKKGYDVAAVVFDSPGTKTIVENEWGKDVAEALKDKVIIHNATPNVINTINDQLGEVYQLEYTGWTNAWRNYFHTDTARDLAKWSYKIVTLGFGDSDDVAFGNAISTHSLSKFEPQLDPSTGEFYKEKHVPDWNEIHERSPLMKGVSNSYLLNKWFAEDHHDAISNTKVAKIASAFEDATEEVASWGSWAQDKLCFWCSDDEQQVAHLDMHEDL